ncbi:unnamed protein product, partial [Prorocentrum cordatum]
RHRSRPRGRTRRRPTEARRLRAPPRGPRAPAPPARCCGRGAGGRATCAGCCRRSRFSSPSPTSGPSSRRRAASPRGRGRGGPPAAGARGAAGRPRPPQVVGVPAGPSNWWLLKPPFPEIEVIQWRCKLREEDGTVSVDAAGNELYGEREWYTLDNRRLYCLQKAATARHPAQVRCPVVVIQQEEGNCREFRKFRTPDRGRTVGVGHKETRPRTRGGTGDTRSACPTRCSPRAWRWPRSGGPARPSRAGGGGRTVASTAGP